MRVDTEYDQVKEAIVDASKQVFTRFGYAKVSMDDISKASKKGRSTLYHYFKNKKEVFEAFATREFTRLMYDARDTTAEEFPIRENLFKYHSAKLTGIKGLMHQYSNILEDIRDQPDFFQVVDRMLLKQEADITKGIINWGIMKGEIADMKPDDLDFLATVLVTAFRSFEHEIAFYDRMVDLEDKLYWLTDILCKGLK